MNFYARHIGDYLKDTAHLSLLEHGIYTRLLDVYYTREGGIPDAQAARLVGARTAEEVAAVEMVLAEFFTLTDGLWVQERCEREIAEYAGKRTKAKEAARASWQARGKQSERNADAEQTHSERSADAMPPSNHKPVTNTNTSVANATGAGAPPTSEELIWGLGVPLLMAASVAEKQARSFLGAMRKAHGDRLLLDALQRCADQKPLEPISWLQSALKRKPTQPHETTRDRAARARVEAFAPGVAAKAPGGTVVTSFAEVIDVAARRLG